MCVAMSAVAAEGETHQVSSDSDIPAAAAPAQTPLSPAGKARIRLFGQNGVSVRYYENSRCYSINYFGDGGVVVSGGLGDTLASFAGMASNTSIGMPATPNSSNPESRNGILSKAYFREYAVTAGEPLTVMMSFASGSVRSGSVYCRAMAITVVPEEGKDYEAALDIGNKKCRLVINEIQSLAGEVKLTPIPGVEAGRCP